MCPFGFMHFHILKAGSRNVVQIFQSASERAGEDKENHSPMSAMQRKEKIKRTWFSKYFLMSMFVRTL